MPEFNNEPEDKYTLEGISGMVIMDRVHDETELKKGESATSGSRSENSDTDHEKE